MSKSGKDIFGKGFKVRAEVTNGMCPLCDSPTIFVSIYKNFFRCMHCGGDTEQKVNGVIKYIPSTPIGSKPPILTQFADMPEDNG